MTNNTDGAALLPVKDESEQERQFKCAGCGNYANDVGSTFCQCATSVLVRHLDETQLVKPFLLHQKIEAIAAQRDETIAKIREGLGIASPLPATQEDAERSGVGVSGPIDAIAQGFWLDLVEKDDRTSPEEYPDMALISHDELVGMVRYVAALSTPAMSDLQRQEYDGEAVGEALDKLISAVVEEAEQACRYLGKHNQQGEASDYSNGFQDACELLGTGTIIAEHVERHRDRIRAALAHPAQARDEMLESLTTSPLIEAITPTNDEWEACDTVQDTYDLMKRRIRAALSSDKREER